MPHRDDKPGEPAKRRAHLQDLELRMARQGYVNPSRVAEIVKQTYASVYRWGSNGHVDMREVRGRKFFEMQSLAKHMRDPETFAAIQKHVEDFIKENTPAEPGNDGGLGTI